MKGCLAVAVLICAAQFTRAQEQEQKLVDRLLKPNMELGNSAQNKKFYADKTSVHKQATVGAFYWQQKSNTKTFNGTRDFSAQDFDSHPFYAGKNGSTFETQPAKSAQRSATVSSNKSVRSFQGRDKAAGTGDYSGNRPYLEKGKSQKSLDRKNPPMTIEQVRELLNKNK